MEIEKGHIYRSKKPRAVGFFDFYDDRLVLYVTDQKVQYDSPTVRDGRKFPTIDRAKFEAWVGQDVTEGYPMLDWAVKNNVENTMLCKEEHVCLRCHKDVFCGTYTWACPWVNDDEDKFCDNCLKELYSEE